MNFQNSIKNCFNKYATFKGRASRSEFWYFYLFIYGTIVLSFLLPRLNFSGDTNLFIRLTFVFITLIPMFAVTARRLHDIGKSGWWQLIASIPYVGIIGVVVLIVWWCTEGEKKKNKFGPPIKLKK